jgi:hypothetical protein
MLRLVQRIAVLFVLILSPQQIDAGFWDTKTETNPSDKENEKKPDDPSVHYGADVVSLIENFQLRTHGCYSDFLRMHLISKE